MGLLLKDEFAAWMKCLMERFDRIARTLEEHGRMLEHLGGKSTFLDGERLLDNQDVCHILNISKRTLQRYRSLGELPFQSIGHKTFYKASDLEVFIRRNFEKSQKNKAASASES